MSEEQSPKAGEECPTCHYAPLYEDAGEVICVGCNGRWPASATDSDTNREEED